MRAFYAIEDTRTPTFNAMILNGANVLLAWQLSRWVPPDLAIPALGLAYALSYWIGLVTLARQLRRRLERLDGYLVVRTYVRVTGLDCWPLPAWWSAPSQPRPRSAGPPTSPAAW